MTATSGSARKSAETSMEASITMPVRAALGAVAIVSGASAMLAGPAGPASSVAVMHFPWCVWAIQVGRSRVGVGTSSYVTVWWPGGPSFVADVDHHEACRPARQLHLDLVVDAFPEQGTGQRRVDADMAQRGVGLVRSDDAVAGQLAGVDPLQFHPGAEEHRLRIRGRGLDHAQGGQALAEVTHPAVDPRQLLLAIGVL